MKRIIQLVLRCQKDKDHAKVFRLDAGLGMGYAETLAALLDGSSAYYIYPPGDLSPIGVCSVCRGKLQCEISERSVKESVPTARAPIADVFGDVHV